MSAGQKFLGGSIKFDITVPLNRIPEFLTTANKAVDGVVKDCRPVSFGHFGDGNIHYNITQPADMDKDEFLGHWDAMSDIVFDIVGDLGGSISAEHGIGIMKKEDLAKRADPVKLAMLKSIKTALDPTNMMNPRVMIWSVKTFSYRHPDTTRSVDGTHALSLSPQYNFPIGEMTRHGSRHGFAVWRDDENR